MRRAARRRASILLGGLTVYFCKPRVLIVLFLGFSAGLPLALSGRDAACTGLREAGVESQHHRTCSRWSARPTRVKFLWAPAGRRARRAYILAGLLDAPRLADPVATAF